MIRNRRPLLRRLAPSIACVALLVPAATRAQTSVLDDGAFRVLIGGREVGRETFSIRQNGSGADAVISAQGRVTLTSQDLTASLELRGQSLRPAAYQMKVQGDGQRSIVGRVIGGRFSAQIASPSGEQLREYLASDGAIVLDDGVAHQYYFVARKALDGATSVPLLIPRENRQVMASVSVTGVQTIQVGGRSVQARHILVQPKNGDTREVWVDGDGRVLRVAIPARDYVAERDAPPA